jgi:predicted DNA-binding transcriptional regulator AlpA
VAEQQEWFTKAELAEWLGLDGPRAIEWMVYTGTAPRHYKIAGKLRFRRSDIETWLKSRTVEPAQAH